MSAAAPSSPPELLAPAGDWDCVRAAIENGADAVYFGLDSGFNARARAKNFAPADLPEILACLHRHGLRGYVTLNTLIFSGELPAIERHVREIAAANVDAVLVQDVGLARLIRHIAPDLPLHASTQMTLTSSQCIAVAQELGLERVVLARELSLAEIRRIRAETAMPLEVFVHGALCVAYSGQCLTSESFGGRSANRGQCAQACRLPYDLFCDGVERDLGDAKYLLSPQDLAAYALVPELVALGVCSLKIEGRLKTPEYVANITRHYRTAIDAAVAGRPVEFAPRQVEEMELSFSRGFSPGWLRGCDHKMLVPALSSSKRGVLLGKVLRVGRGRVLVELSGRVKRGDGVSFDCGKPVDDEQGGRVYELYSENRLVDGEATGGPFELAFAHGAVDFSQIWPGQTVWKTDDPQLTSRLRKTFSGDQLARQQPVDLSVVASEGAPLRVAARLASGAVCSVESPEPLAQAARHPLTLDTLREQFGRLGGTPFRLAGLEATISGSPHIPFSVLGKLRHELVARLEQAALARPERPLRAASPLADEQLAPPAAAEAPTPPQLHVLCRSLAQLRETLAAGFTSVYVDFQDIREYRAAVAAAREAAGAIWLATPRIQKPDEFGIFRALAKHGADGVLARNFAGLRFFQQQGTPVVADFSLNCANELTFAWLREQGALRCTASYDLNREQLLELASAAPAAALEAVVHQHMPMFHMEHCVFCAVLSPGTNKTNCGRPCDRHDVQLRDRVGVAHLLRADVGCRNTLFNAVPQSGAEVVPALLAAGVRHFRVELLTDEREPLLETLQLYRRLLAGDVSGKEVWSRLRATNRVGVTRGTLEERRHPLAIG